MIGLEAKISIDISNVQLTLYEKNGRVTQKTTDYHDFLQFLNGLESPRMISIPKLPFGYFAGKIANESTFDFVVVLPEKVGVLTYFGKPYIIPFPSLALKYAVQENRLVSAECYALDTDAPCEDSVLYTYPFGNVSPGTRKICWGGNVLPKIQQPSDLNMLTELFVTSDSNSDYWHLGSSVKPWNKSRNANLQSFIKYLTKQKKFPVDTLIASDRTLKDIC